LTPISRHRPGGRALLALAVAGGLAALGLLALTTGFAATARSADCSREFGSFGVGKWPGACWRPYGPSSPFNRPIPAAPRLAPESKAIVDYMASNQWSFPGDHGRFALNPGGSRPVFWSNSSDPLVTVICRHFRSSCRTGMRLHIPAGAEPQGESDGHMTVVDQSLHREFDFWQASPPQHSQIVTSAASSIPIGPASGTGLGGAGEAAYLGLMGGLIRAPELAAGNINHALVMAVQCVQPRDVWPAPATGRGDLLCGAGAGPHLGSLIQLAMSDGEIAASHAPAWQRAIMRAMSHYGIYVVDTNGPGNTELSLLKEDDESFTSFGYPGQMSTFVRSLSPAERLAGVPIDVSKLRVIAPCVPRGSC
jgi:hypothetical protein